MKTAVIGCGGVSVVHFRALKENPDAEIIAVCDIKPERAQKAAAEFGGKAYCNFGELLANEKPDTVHICTPHYLHTPMAIAALEAGINVLLEKPCSVSDEETVLLKQAQEKSGKQLAVCFQNRYNLCVCEAKNIIESGSMGAVRSIRAFVTWDRGADYYSDDWHGTKDKECGGVLINQAIHTVDLVQYLGGRFKKITAHVANDHLKGVIEVEDNACILAELDGGASALIYATTAYAENSDVLIDITLEKGKLRIEGEKLCIQNGDGFTDITKKNESVYHGQSYWGTGHGALINDFYDCLKSGRKFAIDAYEGSVAARAVFAAYKSSESGLSIEL